MLDLSNVQSRIAGIRYQRECHARPYRNKARVSPQAAWKQNSDLGTSDHEVTVVGAGAAGLTAGYFAAKSGAKVMEPVYLAKA